MLKIYYFSLDNYTDSAYTHLSKTISSATLDKIKTYKNKKTKISKLIGEVMIRRLIAKNFNIYDLTIEIAKHGKPYINKPNIHFNISHSGKYIVCAISNEEIGVDIEKISRTRMQVAQRFFHRNEITILESLCSNKQQHTFFRLWAAKESYLKYIGTGLTMPLSDFEIVFKEQNTYIQKEHSQMPLHIQECHIDSNYSCFITSKSAEKAIVKEFLI